MSKRLRAQRHLAPVVGFGSDVASAYTLQPLFRPEGWGGELADDPISASQRATSQRENSNETGAPQKVGRTRGCGRKSAENPRGSTTPGGATATSPASRNSGNHRPKRARTSNENSARKRPHILALLLRHAEPPTAQVVAANRFMGLKWVEARPAIDAFASPVSLSAPDVVSPFTERVPIRNGFAEDPQSCALDFSANSASCETAKVLGVPAEVLASAETWTREPVQPEFLASADDVPAAQVLGVPAEVLASAETSTREPVQSEFLASADDVPAAQDTQAAGPVVFFPKSEAAPAARIVSLAELLSKGSFVDVEEVISVAGNFQKMDLWAADH